MTTIIRHDSHHLLLGSCCNWLATPLKGAAEVAELGSVIGAALAAPYQCERLCDVLAVVLALVNGRDGGAMVMVGRTG